MVLSFWLSGNAYASCLDDVELKVKQPSHTPHRINFEFLNNNNKSIEITEIRISTADNQTIKSYEPFNEILKPFGRVVLYMNIADINQKVWKKSGYSCRYE